MKRIALFILLIFSLVQVSPAMQSVFGDSVTITFTTDEEKGTDKSDIEEKKEKKDYQSIYSLMRIQSLKIVVAFHLTEKIHAFPCLEKLTPPPNFC